MAQHHHPAHSSETPRRATWRTAARPKVWLLPVVVVIVVMGALATLYLDGSIHASTSLHDFPVAVVNQDKGATLPDGSTENVGKQITEGITQGVDPDTFDVKSLTLEQAKKQMDDADLYGAIVVPASFSKDLLGLASSAASADAVTTPQVTVLTNPRTGTGTPSIVTQMATKALTKAQASVGQQLLADTQKQVQAAGGTVSGAAQTQLSTPFTIEATAYHPLPDGTGNGLSAFYFALLIVLAGFTGSMIVNTFVDSNLGFVPAELGPRYDIQEHSGLSRFATLVTKWAIMACVALAVAGAYVGVSYAVGMPVDRPWILIGYTAAMIWAVAVVAQTVSAIFGGIGMLINLFLFIVFSLPSAGGAIPLEATPGFFRWLGSFEPMHQIYLGTRSVLYLDATQASGLGRAFGFGAVSVVLGVLVGWLAMRRYDQRGYVRAHQLKQLGSTE